jgi:DNA topoisomerase-2
MKKIEDKYKVLNHIDHILLRPQTYLGSNKPHTSHKWLYNGKKMIREEITYVPSFLKIFDELIINSIDESKRNPNLNKIEVNLDLKTNKISVRDNGGIPVVIHKDHNKYVPEVIFSNLMSGSNYDDTEDRTGSGTNGYGAKLTNVFSKEFILSTCDGKNKFYQVFTNNMRSQTKADITKSKINHTQITYTPDYEKFGLKSLDETHLKIIQKRVIDIAGCNPQIKVYFNNELINFKSFEDYVKLYDKEDYCESSKDLSWSVGVAHSDSGFNQVSFCNSTETYDGGTHIEYITNQIVGHLRDFFQKKYKVDVRPNDVRNHMFIFLNTTVINPSFSSQTKEKLITEVKDYGYTYEVSKKMIQTILKSEIVKSILDWIEQKKKADESRLERNLNRIVEKVKVDKLIDAKGKERWKCSIGIFEGDSASNSFRKYRDPNLMGAFSLRGKFINVLEITNQKLIQNIEAINLMASIGLKIGKPINLKDLRYGRILIYTDSDKDGDSIVALLLNFFNKYWPEMFDRDMIYKVETPILVATKKSDKKKKVLFYNTNEYDNWLKINKVKDYEIKYKKGLAALLDDEYHSIINNPKLTLIKKDDFSDKSLDIWFGKSSDLRKNELLK